MNSKVAAIQMVSTYDVEANLRTAASLIEEAAAAGAKLLVLPENFAVLDSGNLAQWGEEERAQGVFTGFLAQQSARHQVWIVGGTIPMVTRANGEPVSEGRVNACSLLYDDQGKVVARYDKMHLFDVVVEDKQGQYQESRVIEPGLLPVAVDTPFGKLGLTVCYDLRFPELYSYLAEQGCTLFTVPSAFTARTGAAHWEPLLRARAIEQQAFVIAPNQGGEHSRKRHTWGHTMIIDPWGCTLGQHESGPGVVVVELDLERLQSVRDAMPVQQHKRFRAIVKA